MADKTFALSLTAFAQKAPEKAREVVRKVSIDLLTATVMRTPVGNPELWAVNRIAKNYNAAVAQWNAEMRNDPVNLTRAGRLKPGKKSSDSMDIIAPKGYVGGRLRANWFASIGGYTEITTDATDAQGNSTISDGAAIIDQATGDGDIFIVNSLPYAVPIEYGHSGVQAPQGMVRVTIAEFQDYVAKAANEALNS
ncbi:hypothetical protein [Dyella caseinilytica]|uniref:HK97 gp10 family phage protein n=1 Tax=Dyella caseinilytica TaxID=1849581 RepID=A0ABX7GQQ0_9GAMM|nr:hypothetical protein [Dyella caseinilytica]QRN52393.1 hypothetical protein ISN74_12995 [Dyella caseinilytica]GGA05605.1 hypothetical protein GCM10011408_28160 [Dyella caseinilytica]